MTVAVIPDDAIAGAVALTALAVVALFREVLRLRDRVTRLEEHQNRRAWED